MRAALLTRYREPLEIGKVEDPACPRDGVVLSVGACGVCRSDWHGWIGHHPAVSPPHIPGHEFAGIVEEVGPDCRNFVTGQRVTAPFILACGQCADCAAGNATICENQHVVGFGNPGAFAERLAVPHADFNLVRLPDELGFVDAAGMGCRVTTAFRALVDRAAIRPGEWLAVHGCGGVGLSAILLAGALGARTIAVDVNPDALAHATRLGAELTLDGRETDDVGGAIRDLTGGGAQVSIDALGITETFHNSLGGLAKLGRHVQIGLPLDKHATPPLPLLDLVYMRQLTLMGTRGMAASRFPAMFELIKSNGLEPSVLVARTIALEDASSVFADMDSYAGTGITVIDRF